MALMADIASPEPPLAISGQNPLSRADQCPVPPRLQTSAPSRGSSEKGHKRSRPRGKHRGWQLWGKARKSDRQPYPGRRPTIALARTSIETCPLASIGTCSRTRDLSCVTSAVAIVVSIGARLGAAIVVDQ